MIELILLTLFLSWAFHLFEEPGYFVFIFLVVPILLGILAVM